MCCRRTLIAALLLLSVTAASSITLVALRLPYAERQFERISLGMPRAEVENILGPPSQLMHQRQIEIAVLIEQKLSPLREVGPPESALPPTVIAKLWYLDEQMIFVVFDDNDAVCRAEIFAPLSRPSWIDRLRRGLGR